MKPSRREFVQKGRDALVVGFSLYHGIPPAIEWGQTAAPATPSEKSVIPEELDSWLSIGRDGMVTVYTGRIDMGTGIETAFGQLIADELDVPFESVKIVMGDTELTPDQGKSTASSNASVGAQPLRIAAAEARRTLLKMAADRFSVSVDELDDRSSPNCFLEADLVRGIDWRGALQDPAQPKDRKRRRSCTHRNRRAAPACRF